MSETDRGLMSIADVRARLARIELRHAPIPTELHAYDDEWGRCWLTVRLTVADRETGEGLLVSHTHPLGWDDDTAEVREAVRRAWEHELDEAWHVDGVRVRDPHASAATRRHPPEV